MKIKILKVGMMNTNCYIISDNETNEAAIIDPGDEFELIVSEIEKLQVNLICIFITHGHFNHISVADKLREFYRVPIACAEDAEEYLKNQELNLGFLAGLDINMEPDDILFNGDIVHIGNLDIKAISVLGHAKGSLCYYIESENVVFSGDTLLKDSIGNTDMDINANHDLLISEITENLLTLPYETIVYPGHGEQTTIEHEKMRLNS
ncbi:MAG TPA: MBL fold metallo-hydrolase [Clostridiales bacterium]|nr:MBL fold metallo-hydrolase [Clostridiales bacterium]